MPFISPFQRKSPTKSDLNPSNGMQNAAFLQDTYRALLGELSAVLGYTYDMTFFEKELPGVSRLLESISMDEMKHYEALSKLLFHLGGQFNPQTGVNIKPIAAGKDGIPHAALRVLESAMQEEGAAALEYRRLAKAAPTEEARHLLLHLAEDEEAHAASLQGLHSRMARS